MTFHHDTGKGSRPREYSVTQEEFGKKFDAIDWSKKAEAPRDIFAEIVEGFDALAAVRISGGAKGPGMDAVPELELCRCCHNERGMWESGQWVECPACKE